MCCGLITVIVVLPHDYSVIFSSSVFLLLLLLHHFFRDLTRSIATLLLLLLVLLYFFPDVPSFHFIFAWFFFVPRNVQLLLAVCIVENEGGDFRKTMCNELFLWPRIYAHHFWWWHFLFVFVSLIIHDLWRHDVITHFFLDLIRHFGLTEKINYCEI